MQSAWETLNKMKNSEIDAQVTVDQTMNVLYTNKNEALQDIRNAEVEDGLTVKDVMEKLMKSPEYKVFSDEKIPIKFKVSDVIDVFGWKKVKDAVDEKSMEAGQNSNYDKTRENVMECWITLVKMGLLMAILSVIALEFIDKDKR